MVQPFSIASFTEYQHKIKPHKVINIFPAFIPAVCAAKLTKTKQRQVKVLLTFNNNKKPKGKHFKYMEIDIKFHFLETKISRVFFEGFAFKLT